MLYQHKQKNKRMLRQDVENKNIRMHTDLQAVLFYGPFKWVHNLPANEDA